MVKVKLVPNTNRSADQSSTATSANTRSTARLSNSATEKAHHCPLKNKGGCILLGGFCTEHEEPCPAHAPKWRVKKRPCTICEKTINNLRNLKERDLPELKSRLEDLKRQRDRDVKDYGRAPSALITDIERTETKLNEGKATIVTNVTLMKTARLPRNEFDYRYWGEFMPPKENQKQQGKQEKRRRQ